MAPITSKVEIELAGRGNGWTEITSDVLSPVRIGYGIRGAGPGDRTASSGSMTFLLNNSTSNSVGRLGYYSPGGSEARVGWTLGVRVRASFQDPATSTWYTRFVGSVTTINPVPGISGPRTVQVVATDWMDEAARSTVSGLATQFDKRSDEIITLLVNNVTRAPEGTSIATGRETFAYAIDTARDDRPNPVLQEIARVTNSELGYTYVKGDGTVVFEARSDRVSTADDATFDNDMSGLSVSVSRDAVISRMQVVTHPRTVDSSTQVLYRLQSTPLIDPNATLDIVGGYTDPSNRAQRIGGKSMVTPVATTDYTANSLANGSGTNLTSSITVTATFASNSARFTVTNTGSVPAYLTKLNARGIGIYDYEQTVAEAEDATAAADFGEQVVALDMPYQTDVAMGVDAARYLLSLYSATEVGIWSLGTAGSSELGVTTQLAYRVLTTVGSVSVAPKTAALQTQILARDIGDRVGLQETVTGLSTSFYIHAVDLEVRAPGVPFVTWTLAPADTTTYWSLGSAGASELGLTTRLSF